MIGRCLILFPIGGYMRNHYITSIGLFYNNMGFYLEGVWLWRISEDWSRNQI